MLRFITNLFYRCNLEGSVVQASMSLQSGYPDYLVLHIIGSVNVKPSESFKIHCVS